MFASADQCQLSVLTLASGAAASADAEDPALQRWRFLAPSRLCWEVFGGPSCKNGLFVSMVTLLAQARQTAG